MMSVAARQPGVTNEVLRSVGLIGNFGGDSPVYDGQTLRTRLLRSELLQRLSKDAVHTADSSVTLRAPFRLLTAVLSVFRNADLVLIMPGERGLRALLPVFLLLRAVCRTPVHYLVVGGWLPAFLSTRPLLRKGVARLDGLHVQSRRMCRELTAMGISRVSYLPNFRNFPVSGSGPVAAGDALRLVFLSRVIPEKGVALCVESVERVNQLAGRVRATLDIWGPLQDAHKHWLEGILEHSAEAVRYRGPADPERVVSLLADYDVLLFPTWYAGEGFPGVVVEAYAAGIPVLASRWQDNEEVIEQGVTGMLVATQDQQALTAAVLELVEQPELLQQLKRGAKRRAASYHVDQVIPSLLQTLGVNVDRPASA